MLASELKAILSEVPDDAKVVTCLSAYENEPIDVQGVFLMKDFVGNSVLNLTEQEVRFA